MATTPMTDGANPIDTSTRRPPARRMAVLAAVGIALLMALPLPVLAGAVTAHGLPSRGLALPSEPRALMLAPSEIGIVSHMPLAMQRIVAAGLVPATRLSAATPRGAFDSQFAGPSAAALAPRPATPTGNNYFGLPCSTSSALSPINGTNSTLLAAVSTNYLLYENSGGSFCSTVSVSPQYSSQGFLATERSTDRGQTWTTGWLPQNLSWTNAASNLNGSVPGILFPITNGGPGYATPSIAAANDGTVLLGTQFYPGCWVTGCTNASQSDPAGVAVARSIDGGASWVNTTVLATHSFFTYLSGTPTCTLPANFYLTGAPYSPSIAINPSTDDAVATWEMLGLHIDLGACLEFFSGTVQSSFSLNGGASWSKPVNVTANSSFNPQIAIGPAPTHGFTILYQNFLNGTKDNSTGAIGANWAWISSANNGSTWTTPADIGTAGGVNLLWPGASAPNSFFVDPNSYTGFTFSVPGFAIDSSPTSTHTGNEYVVWSDNHTAASTDQGVPSIAFQERASGAPAWTGVSYLTAATRSTAYFEPAISVAPDGSVWVTFYGMAKSSGDLRMYAVYSTDGGTTWSTVSEITTQASVLANGLISIGFANGIAATTAGTFATWMDCRSNSCLNSYNETTMVSLVEPVGFTSTATGVNLTVTTNGAAQTIPLPGKEAWTVGSNHTVAAPGWIPSPPVSVESFVNFTGVVNSTTFTTTFSYGGGSNLVVNYVTVPASFIGGFFSPNTTFDKLTIDGYNVPLIGYNATTLRYNYSVASGRSYYLNASASNLYTPLTNQVVGTTPSQTTTFDVNLAKTHGWLRGVVTPFNATILVNGQAIAVDTSDGMYNVSEFWGSYWLNASGFGVTSYSNYVTVNPVAATTDNIVLSGGWIRGALTATFPGIALTLDGVAITGLTGATFNQSVLGGKHVIGATATGYNSSLINVSVIPGHTTMVAVNLTNQGTVIGQVGPAAALPVATLSVVNLSLTKGSGGARINTATGAFMVNVTGDAYYTVTVKAVGFTSFTTNVLVKPGQDTAPVIVTLVAIPPKTNCTTNGTCPMTPVTPSSSGISLALVGGIIVVVVLVAAVAAVLLMRRRGGGSASAPAEETAAAPETPTDGSETYGGGSYGGPPAQ